MWNKKYMPIEDALINIIKNAPEVVVEYDKYDELFANYPRFLDAFIIKVYSEQITFKICYMRWLIEKRLVFLTWDDNYIDLNPKMARKMLSVAEDQYKISPECLKRVSWLNSLF